jgi:hypothetical protein
MRKVVIPGLIVLLMAGGSVVHAQEAPQMPAPQKEHQWLQQFVGEWDTQAEGTPEPGKPPIKCKGTETARAIGGFWMISETKGKFMDTPVTGIMTLGYDAEKQKYVGTWVCSMTNFLWKYEGTVDASGKVLTLETEGPCPSAPGKLARFRDVTEFKSKDHKVLTSSMQAEDGKWVTFATIDCWRKNKKQTAGRPGSGAKGAG